MLTAMPILIDGTSHEDGVFPLQLTEGPPHRLKISPGQGGLSMGPRASTPKADLWVDADARLHWACFEPFATPAGSPWPRQFYYSGNDSTFFAWSRQRPIEGFKWQPLLSGPLEIDASQSRIRELSLYLQGNQGHISLKLPSLEMRLHLHGDLSQISVTAGLPESLSLSPATSKRSTDAALQLPDMGGLTQVSSLELCNNAGHQPISLQHLSQFPRLESLSLWGNFCDLEQLAQCTELKSLSLRFMPNLQGLPPLQSWPGLDSFIACNVEEATGKRLRQQLKERAKTRAWDKYASVSQLRKPEWWSKHYGRPFSSWPPARAKLAHAAFDLAEQQIHAAQTLNDIQAALTTFSTRFNTVKGIETAEREDLGEAIGQLAQLPTALSLGASDALAQQWFDACRGY